MSNLHQATKGTETFREMAEKTITLQARQQERVWAASPALLTDALAAAWTGATITDSNGDTIPEPHAYKTQLATLKGKDKAAQDARLQLAFDGITMMDEPNLEQAMTVLGMEMCHSLRDHQTLYAVRHPSNTNPNWPHWEDWKQLDDRSEAELRLTLASLLWVRYKASKDKANRYPFPAGNDQKWKLLKNGYLHNRERDLVIDWLSELPPWDQKPRLYSVLPDLFGCDPQDALAQWGSAYLFLGAIDRTLRPGCQLRETLVLVGPQNCGKSTFTNAFLPDAYKGIWHTDALDFSADRKSQMEALQGRLIVECAEMSGVVKAMLERTKSFMTRTDDGGIRGAYAKHPEPRPRRCVIVATTNDEGCLPQDPTGNSRWVPITLPQGADVESYASANAEQIWAEALHLYQDQGHRPQMHRSLRALQEQRNLQHVKKDEELDQLVQVALNALKSEDAEYPYTDSDPLPMVVILNHVNRGEDGKPAYRYYGNQVSAVLKSLGYRRTAQRIQRLDVDGQQLRTYWWLHPNYQGDLS